jgi:hypothetical protein
MSKGYSELQALLSLGGHCQGREMFFVKSWKSWDGVRMRAYIQVTQVLGE